MNHKEYNKETEGGKLAEASVYGIKRGGFIVGEWFYFHSNMPGKVPLSDCSELKEVEDKRPWKNIRKKYTKEDCS
jgi:hypothetical protein